MTDLFEDAFSAVARDGAGLIEVVCRLLKALDSLANCEDEHLADAAREQSRRAVKLAEQAIKLPRDVEVVRALGKFQDKS